MPRPDSPKENKFPLYAPEKEREHLILTNEQKDAVRGITMGLEEADASVRSMAVEDVIQTLENGHPLNRLLTDQIGAVNGYVACEDFIPREAYIKYFGTTKQTGRNLLQEIPAFLEYAKQQGYSKLNFHGWNERLNHILERYGFERLRSDAMGGFNVDFYEKNLTATKSPEAVSQERIAAFEKKYLQKLQQEYQQTLATFSAEQRPAKERGVDEAYESLASRLQSTAGFDFAERQQAILKLKLARHFQNNDTCDINTLYDAIIESPKFISTDRGSLFRLLEVHEEKTLQKIAEIRKERAEMKGDAKSNPYEALFSTASGQYYMARLLNMPHLKEESEYMRHCVGTSDSYVNKMKRGEVEILSFRQAPHLNPASQKLEGDVPLITIEYNLKTKVIEQMKKADDGYLYPDDDYLNDVMDALKQLRTTRTDTGARRDFSRISASELESFSVQDYDLLTDQGEISFRDFNPDGPAFVLKLGEMAITPDLLKTDAAKIVRIVSGFDCRPQELAFSEAEITADTKVYIGPLSRGILHKDLEHIYTSFPGREIRRDNVEGSGKTGEQSIREMEEAGIKISGDARSMLKSSDFVPGEKTETVTLIRLTVADLGFTGNATIDQIYQRAAEFGLELCPADIGPKYRLQYQDQPNQLGKWLYIGMKQITADSGGGPKIFRLSYEDGALWLYGTLAGPDNAWRPVGEFVFRLRKEGTGQGGAQENDEKIRRR